MTDILGWVIGIPVMLVVVLFCWASVSVRREDQQRKAGVLPACGWQYADSDCRCYLEPGHPGLCRANNGRSDWHWHGINYVYDRASADWRARDFSRE